MPGEQARRPVQLLGEQHAHESVRKRHRGQRDHRLRVTLHGFRESVGAADHERDIARLVAPTRELAERLARWRDDARDVAFVIGSADGLAESVKRDAQAVVALSAMTLPHGLVRVLLAEQLYRATSLLAGHPYHRD